MTSEYLYPFARWFCTFPLGVLTRVQDFLAFLTFEACAVPVFAQRSFSFGEVDFLRAGRTLRHAIK